MNARLRVVKYMIWGLMGNFLYVYTMVSRYTLILQRVSKGLISDFFFRKWGLFEILAGNSNLE